MVPLRLGLTVLLIGLVLLYNSTAVRKRWKYADVDVGGYRPKLTDKAAYLKAYVHGVTALAITLGLLALHVAAPWLVLAIVCGAVLLWEPTQGFVNPLDIVAGIAGAFLGAALVVLG